MADKAQNGQKFWRNQIANNFFFGGGVGVVTHVHIIVAGE